MYIKNESSTKSANFKGFSQAKITFLGYLKLLLRRQLTNHKEHKEHKGNEMKQEKTALIMARGAFSGSQLRSFGWPSGAFRPPG